MDLSKQPDLNNPRQVGMNWLITGGCGFIGTNLIKYLVHRGNHRIRTVDNLSVGTTDDLEKVCTFKCKKVEDLSNRFGEGECLVEFIKGDLLDDQLALKAALGADVFFHLAAKTGVAHSV
ncbi:MAG: NAD-dependent epimerase/dehydratase family protein [Ekhidna sp.]